MLTVDGEVHSQSSLLLLAVGRGPVSTGNLNVSLIYIVCTVAKFLFIRYGILLKKLIIVYMFTKAT